jgi:hypothetical protein
MPYCKECETKITEATVRANDGICMLCKKGSIVCSDCGKRTFAVTRGVNTGDVCLKCLGKRQIHKQINSTKRISIFLLGAGTFLTLIHLLLATRHPGYAFPLDVAAFILGGLLFYYAGQIRRWIDLI